MYKEFSYLQAGEYNQFIVYNGLALNIGSLYSPEVYRHVDTCPSCCVCAITHNSTTQGKQQLVDNVTHEAAYSVNTSKRLERGTLNGLIRAEVKSCLAAWARGITKL